MITQETGKSSARSHAGGDADFEMLLEEAGRGRALFLSTEAPGGAGGGRYALSAAESIIASLRSAWKDPDVPALVTGESDGPGPAMGTGRVPPDTLRWIRAGELYEKLLERVQRGKTPSHVFCLDLWAACILSPGQNPCPEAVWVFVTDLDGSVRGQGESYWREMEEWIRRLPFARTIPLETLRRIAETRLPSSEVRSRDKTEIGAGVALRPLRREELRSLPSSEIDVPGGNPYLGRWKVLRSSLPQSRRIQEKVTVLTRYAGTLLYLRPFLDSLARQTLPAERFGTFILAPGRPKELDEYLKVFGLAHPELKIRALDGLAGGSDGRSGLLRGLASEDSPKALVVVESSLLLPAGFLEWVEGMREEEEVPRVSQAVLSLECAAHILTGNLDPFPHYEELLNAHRAQGSPPERGNQGAPLHVFRGKALERLRALPEGKIRFPWEDAFATWLQAEAGLPPKEIAGPVLLRFPLIS